MRFLIVRFRYFVLRSTIKLISIAMVSTLLAACSDDDGTTKTIPPVSLSAISVVQGPITNPANGHVYYRLSNSNWSTAQDNAEMMLGGHLVAINDAAENNFVLTTFANANGSGRVWLGLNDATNEGTFTYSNGDQIGYTHWEPGEPNNSGGENYVLMYSNNGNWNDVKDLANPIGIGPVYGVVEANAATSVFVVQGPLTNPANGHVYYRLSNSNWSEAESFAVDVLGGHLVVINDEAENNYVLTNFANASGSGRVWLGLNDVGTEGNFVYSSGDPLGYTHWEPNEPNNNNNEDFVLMYSGNGNWNDVRDLANPPGIGNVYGVVEIQP
jgi:hypothetical protein